MIGIINLGIGNIISVKNMIAKIGYESSIINNGDQLDGFNKIILPGVGSFDHGIYNLEKKNFSSILNDLVIRHGTPILGICLGMQLMTKKSEEGKLEGLGWIDAETIKFKSTKENDIKIPHMGWNKVDVLQKNPLMTVKNEKFEKRFYFVHSYYVSLSEQKYCIAETSYGETFTSVFKKDNIYGVQFHPEKSHKYGMSLLKNFCNI